MPPPKSIQDNEQLNDLNDTKKWGGQYSWQPPKKRATLDEMGGPITPDTEATYRALMKRWLCERHHMSEEVDDDWLMVRRRVSATYHDLIDVFDDDGKPGRFVVMTPTFSDIVSAVSGRKGQERKKPHVCVPMLDTEKGWQLDLDALQNTLQPGDLLILCNPNNPNGYVYTEQDLQAIVACCKQKGVKIVSDDIWSDQIFHPEKQHTPIINVALQQNYQNAVAMTYSTGKAFNTTQIPCSLAIIPDPEMRERVRGLGESQDHVTQLGAELAINAIKEGGDGALYIDQLNTQLLKNAAFVREVLEKMGCKVHPSDANSVLFVQLPSEYVSRQRGAVRSQISAVTGSSTSASKRLLDLMGTLHIGYIPGEEYGPVRYVREGKEEKAPQYIRVNIGCPLHVLQRKYGKLQEKWENPS